MQQLSKIVKVHTVIHDPETGMAMHLAPGDEVPAWATVTNPEVVGPQEASTAPNTAQLATLPDGFTDLPGPPESMTRDELIGIAQRLGLSVGVDFPKSANKETVFAAIKHYVED